MPQSGCCADITCSREATQLYECHCCNCSICLTHLLEHVEIAKRNRERSDVLRHDLVSALSTLKSIVEKKLQELEREQTLIHQAAAMLSMPVPSINDIQSLLGEITKAITANQTGECSITVIGS